MQRRSPSILSRALIALVLPAALLACDPSRIDELAKAASSGGGQSTDQVPDKPLPPPPPPKDPSDRPGDRPPPPPHKDPSCDPDVPPPPPPSDCKHTTEDGLSCQYCPDGREGFYVGCHGDGGGGRELAEAFNGAVCSAWADDTGRVTARKCHGTYPTKNPGGGSEPCQAISLEKIPDGICTICLGKEMTEVARSCNAGMEFLATRKF